MPKVKTYKKGEAVIYISPTKFETDADGNKIKVTELGICAKNTEGSVTKVKFLDGLGTYVLNDYLIPYDD